MNLITFDLEEWFLNHHSNGPKEKYAEYDRYFDAILNKLDEHQLKATFFCVGEMGRLFPEVIRKIQQRVQARKWHILAVDISDSSPWVFVKKEMKK